MQFTWSNSSYTSSYLHYILESLHDKEFMSNNHKTIRFRLEFAPIGDCFEYKIIKPN